MATIVRTQAELDSAIKLGKLDISIHSSASVTLIVSGSSRVEAWGSSRVEAWGSSRVEAWGSSRVVARESSSVVAWGSSSVEAWGSSSVEAWGSSRVEAWGSSRVEAWGSSRVVARESSSVVAWGSSSVEAWGSSRVVARESSSVVARESSSVVARESSSVVARESSSVVARGFVSLSLWGKVTAKLSIKCHAFIHSKDTKATGGQQTKAIIKTPKDWCDYYGVKVVKGVATLYKAVHAEYKSNSSGPHGYIYYTPGTKPEAKDWDGGTQECGRGIHLSPHPRMTQNFLNNPSHYMECKVRLTDMAIHMEGSYPEKCKVKCICRPIVEVDVEGKPIKEKERAKKK